MSGDFAPLSDAPFGLGGDIEIFGIGWNRFHGLNIINRVNALAKMV